MDPIAIILFIAAVILVFTLFMALLSGVLIVAYGIFCLFKPDWKVDRKKSSTYAKSKKTSSSILDDDDLYYSFNNRHHSSNIWHVKIGDYDR